MTVEKGRKLRRFLILSLIFSTYTAKGRQEVLAGDAVVHQKS